ncbi:MAG: TIGR03086 family metal-binding protein [Candidatus Dormiibacterota bacterium]
MTETTNDTTLEEVLGKLEGLLAGVAPGQRSLPTPCSEWDVAALEGHLIGWLRYFTSRAKGEDPDPDPGATRAGDDPAGEFRAAAGELLPALQAAEASGVQPAEGQLPPAMLRTMLTGEYVVHGWDLATATGQAVPFTDAEAEVALGLRSILTPESRGSMFGPELPIASDAPALARLLAFAGRQSA